MRSRLTWRRTTAPAAQKGVVLLAVLWLSVALSLMALSTSYLVRTEAAAASNRLESQRGYYQARGAVEAGIAAIARPLALGAGELRAPAPAEYVPGRRWLQFDFEAGTAWVEIVPENAKLGVNSVTAEQLAALFEQLGQDPDASSELALAIVDWRSPRASSVDSEFDRFYQAASPPYRARHAAVEDLEELLAVKGMTRELFFGALTQQADGAWKQSPPLSDLLTTETALGAVNANSAAAEVLATLPGWNADLAGRVVAARAAGAFETFEDLQSRVPDLATVLSVSPVSLTSTTVYTLTGTAQLNGSSVRRSVRARVRIEPSLPLSHRILGWWEEWPGSPVPEESGQGSAARL